MLTRTLNVHIIFCSVRRGLTLNGTRHYSALGRLLRRSSTIALRMSKHGSGANFFNRSRFTRVGRSTVFVGLSHKFITSLNTLGRRLSSNRLSNTTISIFPIRPGGDNSPFRATLTGRSGVVLAPRVNNSALRTRRSVNRFISRHLRSC